MKPTVKENLIAAKALIDTPEKWTKNPQSTEPACAYAAVGLACNGKVLGQNVFTSTPDEMEAQTHLAAFLPIEFSGDIDVIRFNDHPDTTHADIMALFDRAIAAQDGSP